MKRLLYFFKLIFKKVFCLFACLFPINFKTVVFDNFNGGGYGCNPKYIAEVLKDDDLKLVWLAVNPQTNPFPSYIKAVKYDSFFAWYYLETARVVVTNVRNSKGVIKRNNQKYIQTWHAYLGPKMIEKDAQKSLSLAYIEQAKRNGKDTDLMISNNDFMSNIYASSFWYSGDILSCGLPRNTLLANSDDSIKGNIKNKLGLSLDSLVCLYAPTWRSKGFDVPILNFDKCKKSLQDKFNKEDVVVCVRLHPNTDKSKYCFTSDVIDFSSYPDIQELLAITDVLISDYSSIIEDFIFTYKPAFMYVPDYDSYIKDRNFYYPLNKRPYPICRTEMELWSEIKLFSQDSLNKAIENFKKEFGIIEDGLGSVKVANVIRNWTNSMI